MTVLEIPRLTTTRRMQPHGRMSTNLLSSEWTKIRSVRSTYWTLFVTALTTIGLSAMICAIYVAQYSHLKPADKVGFNPASFSLTGGILAQFAIAVLGVLVITSEYGSGMIRTTICAVPQRLKVLAAKATVFAGVTLAVTLTACFTAFFVGQAILSGKHLGIGIGAPNALRTVVGTSLYLVGLGLLSLGLGTLIRKTAGAISAVVGLIFVLPVLSNFLPSSMDGIQKFLPASAGTAIISGAARAGQPAQLGPWVGLAVFFGYAAIALGAGAYTLVRRDA